MATTVVAPQCKKCSGNGKCDCDCDPEVVDNRMTISVHVPSGLGLSFQDLQSDVDKFVLKTKYSGSASVTILGRIVDFGDLNYLMSTLFKPDHVPPPQPDLEQEEYHLSGPKSAILVEIDAFGFDLKCTECIKCCVTDWLGKSKGYKIIFVVRSRADDRSENAALHAKIANLEDNIQSLQTELTKMALLLAELELLKSQEK